MSTDHEHSSTTVTRGTDEVAQDHPATGEDTVTAGRPRVRRHLGRKLLFTLALLVPGVVGAVAVAPSPASACDLACQLAGGSSVGGCTYNCSGDYRLTTPARFIGVTSRGDLGAVGILLDRGYIGPVKVSAWVWSHQRSAWVVSRSVWLDDNYHASYVTTAGLGGLALYPGTKGAHSVYVDIRYADGRVVYAGYPSSYSNYFWNVYTGSWAWGSYSWAFL